MVNKIGKGEANKAGEGKGYLQLHKKTKQLVSRARSCRWVFGSGPGGSNGTVQTELPKMDVSPTAVSTPNFEDSN